MAAAAHNPRNAFDPLILQKWAGYAHPERIVPTAYLSHTENTVAILDKFPKAIFHVLILPRIRDGLTKEDLKNLRALLGSRSKVSLERAKQLLEAMGEHARMVRDEIQRDMRQRYKFEWDVWIGFHAVPSMEHLHLHVISSDLHSEKMKTKKHYNSFHPTHGFFLHYDDVMSWFDAVPSFFKDKISGLKAPQYMDILKERLSCFQCTQTFSNMPQLKAHLEMHHTTQYNAALRMYERERKAASKPSSKASSTGLPKKRQHDGKPISIASGSSRTSGSH